MLITNKIDGYKNSAEKNRAHDLNPGLTRLNTWLAILSSWLLSPPSKLTFSESDATIESLALLVVGDASALVDKEDSNKSTALEYS